MSGTGFAPWPGANKLRYSLLFTPGTGTGYTIPVSGTINQTLTGTNNDVKFAGARTGNQKIQLIGGANAQLVGGKTISCLWLSAPTDQWLVEGVYTLNPPYGQDAYDVSSESASNGAAVYTGQNLRVEGVQGFYDGFHGDFWQLYGGCAGTKLDRITFYTNYTGLLFSPQYMISGPSYLSWINSRVAPLLPWTDVAESFNGTSVGPFWRGVTISTGSPAIPSANPSAGFTGTLTTTNPISGAQSALSSAGGQVLQRRSVSYIDTGLTVNSGVFTAGFKLRMMPSSAATAGQFARIMSFARIVRDMPAGSFSGTILRFVGTGDGALNDTTNDGNKYVNTQPEGTGLFITRASNGVDFILTDGFTAPGTGVTDTSTHAPIVSTTLMAGAIYSITIKTTVASSATEIFVDGTSVGRVYGTTSQGIHIISDLSIGLETAAAVTGSNPASFPVSMPDRFQMMFDDVTIQWSQADISQPWRFRDTDADRGGSSTTQQSCQVPSGVTGGVHYYDYSGKSVQNAWYLEDWVPGRAGGSGVWMEVPAGRTATDMVSPGTGAVITWANVAHPAAPTLNSTVVNGVTYQYLTWPSYCNIMNEDGTASGRIWIGKCPDVAAANNGDFVAASEIGPNYNYASWH